MDHFAYRDGELYAEDVPVSGIARTVGTPFYCYATATIARHYRVFADAFAGLDAMVCYAVKANGNVAVIRTLANMGAGADVVSEGELVRALAAGVPAERIVFSGVGKTEAEMARALDAGIMQINVESEAELELLNRVAGEKGTRAAISVRVNPDVDARTHEKITTGRRENKFGIDIDRAPAVYARAATMPGIRVVGVALHIGSQLTDLAPYRAAYARARDLALALRAEGHAIERIDLGGGLGIPYFNEAAGDAIPSPAEYGAMVAEMLGDLGCRVVLEPGRVIVGNAGILVSRVLYVKEGEQKRFVIVDAAMNDLLRPSLYGAHHAIQPVRDPGGAGMAPADVVGPVCETGDTFAAGRPLPPLAAGDLLFFRSAGAYGAVMASTYNARPLVPEVLVNGDRFAVVRERMGVEDFLDHETIPDWLGGTPPAAVREAAG